MEYSKVDLYPRLFPVTVERARYDRTQTVDGQSVLWVTGVQGFCRSKIFVRGQIFPISILAKHEPFSPRKNFDCIPASIQILWATCYHSEENIRYVAFEFGSVLSQIGDHAFAYCCSLQSILIPRTVQILGCECFSNCLWLATTTFESNSELFRLDHGVFIECNC
jgi:hypothetical protein